LKYGYSENGYQKTDVEGKKFGKMQAEKAPEKEKPRREGKPLLCGP